MRKSLFKERPRNSLRNVQGNIDSTFPAIVTAEGEWRHTTPEQTQITWISRPIVDQEKSAIDDDAVARTKVGLYCTRRS